MKLTKVYRILKFKQADLLKKCLDFNTNKRKNAADSFEKDFFKLINNKFFWQNNGKFKKNNKC